jgi:hypothetical protein
MHTMTKRQGKSGTIDVKALLASDEEFLRALVRTALQEVLEAEMAEALGAEKGERTAGRQGYRSGYYGRTLITRVGKLELRVPQDRAGRFSTELFERYQRSERALVAALAEMYVQGVSTRKVKAITEELCGHSFSASSISAMNQRLDDTLAHFAGRPLAEAFPCIDGCWPLASKARLSTRARCRSTVALGAKRRMPSTSRRSCAHCWPGIVASAGCAPWSARPIPLPRTPAHQPRARASDSRADRPRQPHPRLADDGGHLRLRPTPGQSPRLARHSRYWRRPHASPRLTVEIRREIERLQLVKRQIAELERDRELSSGGSWAAEPAGERNPDLGWEPIRGIAGASGCPHPTRLLIPICWHKRGRTPPS